ARGARAGHLPGVEPQPPAVVRLDAGDGELRGRTQVGVHLGEAVAEAERQRLVDELRRTLPEDRLAPGDDGRQLPRPERPLPAPCSMTDSRTETTADTLPGQIGPSTSAVLTNGASDTEPESWRLLPVRVDTSTTDERRPPKRPPKPPA